MPVPFCLVISITDRSYVFLSQTVSKVFFVPCLLLSTHFSSQIHLLLCHSFESEKPSLLFFVSWFFRLSHMLSHAIMHFCLTTQIHRCHLSMTFPSVISSTATHHVIWNLPITTTTTTTSMSIACHMPCTRLAQSLLSPQRTILTLLRCLSLSLLPITTITRIIPLLHP